MLSTLPGAPGGAPSLDSPAVTSPAADPDRRADVRVTVTSDDLVALTQGRLNFGTALVSGRLKVDASVLNLLRLRSLL